MTYLFTALGMAIGLGVSHALGVRIDYATFMFGSLAALFCHWLSVGRHTAVKGALPEEK